MANADPTEVQHLGRHRLQAAARAWHPTDVTVTGFAGSGYTLLTDILGAGVFTGKDWPPVRSPVLVVMRQTLSPEQAALLTDLGVGDPREEIANLGIGEALVVLRS